MTTNTTKFAAAVAAAADLDELLDALNSVEPEQTDERLMTSLPTFGGDEPAETLGVWSWDATHMIVGLCIGEFEIVEREDI